MQKRRFRKQIAETMSFLEMCAVMENIKKTDCQQQKQNYLRAYFELHKTRSKTFLEKFGEEADPSFYSVIRLLVPSADKARDSYRVQEPTLVRLYTKVLLLADYSPDAKKMRNHVCTDAEDFGDVIFKVMEHRAYNGPGNLTIFSVHTMLDVLAENDRRRTEDEISRFIEMTTAIEQKWFVRIIIKNLRLYISEPRILDVFHPLAKELYSRYSDLLKVCQIIDSGESIDIHGAVEVFQFIRPMLCQKLDITSVERIFKRTQYYLETKMDGERFQIHMKDGTYKYMSRNGYDYTSAFGVNANDGNLTPLISRLFKYNVRNIILDGEMMVWDTSYKVYRTVGEHVNARNLRRSPILRPCFVMYDLLYLNNINYMDLPYTERINCLHKVIIERKGVLQFCKRKKICNQEELIKEFNAAVTAKEEGVVIKKQFSFYRPGRREGAGWYKLKPDYISGLISEFDLLIIGGYYERTKSVVSTFLVGVAVEITDKKGEYTFGAVCTVNQGLSTYERKKLNELLISEWKKTNVPSYLDFGKKTPDVWIEPRDSCILQVRASELCHTENYFTAYTLRFPRIQCVRSDKAWNECMGIEDYKSYYLDKSKIHKVRKVHKRQLTARDLEIAKKSKLTPENPYLTPFQSQNTEAITTIFKEIDFCILNGSKVTGHSVDDLKAIVAQHSGRLIAYPSLDSSKCICIAGQITDRVKVLKEKKLYNIISSNWLTRHFQGNAHITGLCTPKFKDVINAVSDFEDKIKDAYDEHGDSFTNHVGMDELGTILKDVNSIKVEPMSTTEVGAVEKELYVNSPQFFRNTTLHFYQWINDETKHMVMLELRFLERGGNVIARSELKYNESPVIIYNKDNYDKDDMRKYLEDNIKAGTIKTKIISSAWISECDNIGLVIDSKEFESFIEYDDSI